jgi:hypothetical protein
VERFVTLGGEPKLLRYNSRLPLVVCVPEGVEVRWRAWRADTKTKTAKQGYAAWIAPRPKCLSTSGSSARTQEHD